MSLTFAVKHVMSKPLITVDGEASAQNAMELMVAKDIGALVVTDKGKLVGIVTGRDVLKKCCAQSSCTEVKVKEIMSSPLVTVDAETPIGVAVEIMTDKKIKRLLVTEKGKATGIATHNDLMRGTLEAFHEMSAALSTI